MFGTTIDMKTKLAGIEADLVSAHALGHKQLHAEIFAKFAELVEDPEDIEAMLDAVYDEAYPAKVAAGGFGSFGQQQPGAGAGLSLDLMKLLSRGIMLAGPVMAAAKFLSSKSDHDNALHAVQNAAPQLFQQNPQRAQALFEAIYTSAPNIGKNTTLMVDLLHQLMSMPMVDMGTIAKLTEIAKNVSNTSGGGNPLTQSLGGMSDKLMHQQLSQSMMPRKQASVMVPAKFKAADGRPTVFNWAGEAAKQAGLTDAFTGSGTNMEQANQATMMNQQESGNTLLPLDSVLHELLMKEMELQQREQVMQQQEMQLQQALAAVQHIGSQYQQEAGVDPNTGAPTEDPAAAAPPEGGEAPAMEPAAEGAPEGESAGEMPPEMAGGEPAAEGAGDEAAAGGPPAEEMTAEAPVDENAEPQMPAEVAGGGGDSTGQDGDAPASPVGQDGEGEESANQDPPEAEGQGDGEEGADGTPGAEEQPPEDGEAAPAEGEAPAEGGEDPEAAAAEEAAAMPQADPAGSAAVPLPNVDTSPEAVAAGEAGMAEDAAPMPPADQTEAGAGEGEDAPVGATMDPFSSEYSEGASPMGEPIDNAAPVPNPALVGGEQPEGEAAAETPGEGSETAAEAPAEGGEPPMAEGAEGPASDADEGPIAEGEDTPGEKEDDEEGEGAEGPNTAESVEGSVEDEAKDQALGLDEGSPEDAAADAQLADELNAQGTEATPAGGEEAPPEEAIPPAMPEVAPEAAMAPPMPAAPVAPPAPAMAPQSQPAAGGGHEIVLPLRITVKIGEADPVAAMRADAMEAFRAAMLTQPANY